MTLAVVKLAKTTQERQLLSELKQYMTVCQYNERAKAICSSVKLKKVTESRSLEGQRREEKKQWCTLGRRPVCLSKEDRTDSQYLQRVVQMSLIIYYVMYL